MDSYSGKFYYYIISHHRQELIDILEDTKDGQNYSIIVNFITLFEEDTHLGNGLLTEPEKYLAVFNEAAILAQHHICNEIKESEEKQNYKIKSKVFIRITALPVFGETSFPNNDDLGSLVKIHGTLVKVGAPKLLEYQRNYVCSKCSQVEIRKANYERYYVISPPNKCDKCNDANMKPKKDADVTNYKDFQEVKIQEHFGKSKVGTVPHTIWVTLEDDLVDSCKPGDDVVVTGIVMRRWKPLRVDARYDIELVIKANNLEVWNEQKSTIPNSEIKEAFTKFWSHFKYQELIGRNHILRSFCPQVFGIYLAKLAMVVVLAGGVQKTDANGCSSRGMSHILLVGDAGTAKSHLLRYASKISGRSVFTTGIGSTTAGLTVSAVREGGDWNLEAGALVLADGGICCIDDFNSIREHDRTSIHEAMEQQSISVAKAGIVTKLRTRCSIFATTSPKGKYDRSLPMSVNVAVSSPLLSRFDIVLTLLDTKSSEWDKSLCNFIFKGGKKSVHSQEAFQVSTKSECLLSDIWSLNNLQSYFSIIKQINPVMTSEAGTILRIYYQIQRMTGSRNAARTTVRLLESLIRLSQGHARLMFREKVTVLDAIIAITLIESSLQNATFTSDVNALHTVFPEDPYQEYKSQLTVILTKLELNEILDQELEKLNKEMNMMKNIFLQNSEKFIEKSDEIYDTENTLTGEKFTKKITDILDRIRQKTNTTLSDANNENSNKKDFGKFSESNDDNDESEDDIFKDYVFNCKEKQKSKRNLSYDNEVSQGEYTDTQNLSFTSIKSSRKLEPSDKLEENKEKSFKRSKLFEEKCQPKTINALTFKTREKLSKFKNCRQRFGKKVSENDVSEHIKETETCIELSPYEKKLNENTGFSQTNSFQNIVKLQNIFCSEEDWSDIDL